MPYIVASCCTVTFKITLHHVLIGHISLPPNSNVKPTSVEVNVRNKNLAKQLEFYGKSNHIFAMPRVLSIRAYVFCKRIY